MIYAKLKLRKLEAKLNNFSTPFLETLQSCKIKDVIIAAVLFCVAFSILASLSTEALINGDAAVYLQQMKNLNFSARAVHLGYYLLGAGFIRLFPGPDDYVINLMNCFLGALSVTFLYLITLIICRRHVAALLSSLLLLTHYLFLENSVYAEVYTPQTCFLLLAVLWWLLDRPIIAGLSFALSFLMTPSTLFALPFFLILRPRFRPFSLFCATFLVIAVAAIFPVHRTYFFGSRGLLRGVHTSVNIGYALRKEGREIFFSLFLCIPFVAAGVAELFGQKRLRPLGVAVLALWLVTLFFGEKFGDVPVQLPTYALLCMVGGLGFGMLLRISNSKQYATMLSGIILSALTIAVVVIKATKTPVRVSVFLPAWFLVVIVSCSVLCILVAIPTKFRRICAQVIITGAVILAVVTNGFVAFSRTMAMNKYHTGYRNTVIEMSKLAGPDYLVVGGWTRGILFEHYVFQKSYTPYWINTQCLAGVMGKERQLEASKKLKEAVTARRQIWLLRKHPALFSALKRAGYKITPFRYIYVAIAQN